MVDKYKYTAISFAPVQSFIEKSRKLRDLYGASRILSHLTYRLIQGIEGIKKINPEIKVISPGLSNVQEGMPNRILVKGNIEKKQAEELILAAWRDVLKQCRDWIENKFHKYDPNYQFYWESQWKYWNQNTWEIFWGGGNDIQEAMEDLETKKLSRCWTAMNWVGESSSLTGTDAIIHTDINNRQWFEPKKNTSRDKQEKIKKFYHYLSLFLELDDKQLQNFKSLDSLDSEEPKGKFLDRNERLSVPELAKRLVTREDIGKKLDNIQLEKSFTEIARYDTDTKQKQWTGWFMGDGDKVGDKLKELALQGEEAVKNFTTAMCKWGRQLQDNFDSNFGRVIYSGGDDFLGVIYSQDIEQPIPPIQALDWLRNFPQKWQEHGQDITVSVGFVWAAPRVPQRDILQNCREAEQKAKALGRNRVTIRVLFNSGQYLDWTCRWQDLEILTDYEDRDGIGYQDNNLFSYRNRNQEILDKSPNWSHVYEDLAYLKAHHAIEIVRDTKSQYPVNKAIALHFLNVYFSFSGNKDYWSENWVEIVGKTSYQDGDILNWIDGLINIGWQLCSQEITPRSMQQIAKV